MYLLELTLQVVQKLNDVLDGEVDYLHIFWRNDMKKYRTSEVAKMMGIHPNTVRFYEEWGLINHSILQELILFPMVRKKQIHFTLDGLGLHMIMKK